MSNHQATVVALGELLWDVFPDGPRFGGAPINFAHHVAALGAQTWVVTAVGDDELGKLALERLRQADLIADHVAVLPDLPTGAVQVTLDDAGVPSYRFNNRDAWDELPWTDALDELARQCDAACFGTLGQRSEASRQTIQRFVSATPDQCHRVLDLNLRSPYFDDTVIGQSLELANVLKLNDDELDYLTEHVGLRQSDEAERLGELASKFDLRLVALTKGGDGSVMYQQGRISRQASEPTEVVDTVGAGDAFTAAMVTGLIAGDDLDPINHRACRLAEHVCTRSGAV